MRQVVLERVREIQAALGVGLLEAKRIALAENADRAASNALDEIELLLGEDAARHIDELVKARIAAYSGR